MAVSIYESQDAFAHHISAHIPVSASPMKMSIAGDFLYVSHLTENKISVIDTRTDLLYDEITTSGGLMAVEAIPEKNKIYAAIFQSDGIDVYNADTGLYEKTIILPDAELTKASTSGQLWGQRGVYTFLTGGWSLDYNPNNELLYVTSYNGNVVYVIDTNVDQVGETIPVADDPYTVKVDVVTDKVVVASLSGNAVTILTPVEIQGSAGYVEHEVSAELSIGSAPWYLDIDSVNHQAFVSHRGASHLSVINLLDDTEVSQIPLPGRAQGVAVDEDARMVYTTLFTNNDLLKINGETLEIIDTIETESPSWDLIVEPNSHKIYASYQGEDEVVVLSPESYRETLPVITQEIPVLVAGHILVHGQDARVIAPNLIAEESSIIAGLVSKDGGNLSVQIPRTLLASEQNGQDTAFSVMVNDSPVSVSEEQSNEEYRIISFFVPEKSTTLEIKGSDALPEPQQSSVDALRDAVIMCQDKVWIESTNGRIACVSGPTALILEERGWGTILE